MRKGQPNFFLVFDRLGINPFTDYFEITLLAEGTVRGTVEVAVSRLATFVISLAVLVGMVSQHPAAVSLHDPLTPDTTLNRVAVIGDSYTTGTHEGGLGPQAWTARAWRTLAHQGVQVAADVASEGRAGYRLRGDHGSLFGDLTARAVKPDDALVVFFGSRNDQGVDPGILAEMAHDSFDLARRTAPSTRLLVIGPPWPTADVPDSVLLIRDILNAQARAAGAAFVEPLTDRWFVDRPDLIARTACTRPMRGMHIWRTRLRR